MKKIFFRSKNLIFIKEEESLLIKFDRGVLRAPSSRSRFLGNIYMNIQYFIRIKVNLRGRILKVKAILKYNVQ